jgi:hypothetical protein
LARISATSSSSGRTPDWIKIDALAATNIIEA